jgi:hypothetical protein
VSDINDALNELAQRGEPRGFDQVLAGATESAASDAARRDAEGDDLDTIPFVTSEPAARGRRSRSFGSMIAAAGVAALVLVAAFAVSAVVGSGGAGSAESAVRSLADAISHEDPLAAADVLAPDEVRSLHGTIADAARKAQELQLVQTAGAPLAGVDFNVDGLKLATESLGDGYAKVTIDAGTFSASTHKKQFSALMQKVLRNSQDNSSQSDLAKLASNQNLPTFVVAIRHNGRWYVSAAYTVLEYVREANHLPAADFGSGVRALTTLGADSPDAAVQDSMRALEHQDWSKLMTMVAPDEIPVYDYRDALTTLAKQDNADNASNGSPGFTIDSMSTTSNVDGDTAKVSLKASGTTDSGKWSLDGGCFTPPAGDISVTITCGADEGLGLAVIFGGVDQSSRITVIKRDGRWFVSPVGTVLDAVDHVIAQLDRRTLFTLLNIPNQLPADGRLTLGQPVGLNAANHHLQVLTYDGHKGESLLGQATSTASSKSKGVIYHSPTEARVFAPDGSELGEGGGLLFGQSVTLPADGTYTVVEETFAYLNRGADVTVTIWDTAHAPASAKQSPDGCFSSGNVISGGSQTTCTSSGPFSSSGSISGSGSGSCTSDSSGGQTCTGASAAPAIRFGPNGELLGPDGKPLRNSDGTPITIPASERQAIARAGQNGGGCGTDGNPYPLPVGSNSGSVVCTAPPAPTAAATVTTAPHA